MIFVDSGGWFASLITTDSDHLAAKVWLRTNKLPLVTTDYVVDETLTLLRARGEARDAMNLAKLFSLGKAAKIEFVTPTDFESALALFQEYGDKQWSFTDCTSKVVMERLGITTAFAFDQHFRQFGSVDVVP